MEEARRVLARLERIEALDRGRAEPSDLLAELQALLTEAEAWARAEHPVPDAAIEAVERCRERLHEPEIAERNSGRTLLA
jgi:hypothetical protein